MTPVNCALVMIAGLALGSLVATAQAQTTMPAAKTFKVQTPDGVSIAAQDWGNPDGPEILFIHGFSQSHLSWSRQFGGELAKAFRMITYDIRGHGGSDKPLDAVFYREHRRWAGELKSVMEAANLKKPVLVGWSYTGTVILLSASLVELGPVQHMAVGHMPFWENTSRFNRELTELVTQGNQR